MDDTKLVLDIQGVSHWFGANRVLHDVSLKVLRGGIVALVGPSGCGKSTLLRAIVGTHPAKAGKIVVFSGKDREHGREVCQPGRDRGIVYQKYSLFPFLTAQQNVAFGLMVDQTSLPYRFCRPLAWRQLHRSHLTQAAEFLEKVGLAHAANLYPAEMSGGMQQRVAIAQALIMRPEVLLLDEPFGALDEAMREELQRMLLTLYLENSQALKKGEKPPYTIFIVTHELNEAIFVGDRVVGLSQYWDWQTEGLSACPGATIVYDQKAPVFLPDDERDYTQFAAQRERIHEVVFNPESHRRRNEFRTFWKEVHEDEAQRANP